MDLIKVASKMGRNVIALFGNLKFCTGFCRLGTNAILEAVCRVEKHMINPVPTQPRPSELKGLQASIQGFEPQLSP